MSEAVFLTKVILMKSSNDKGDITLQPTDVKNMYYEKVILINLY